MEWEKIELSTFEQASQNMKYDEIIIVPHTNPVELMKAMPIFNPRLDSHLLSEGNFSPDELIQSATQEYLPDQNATKEQIQEIVGRLFDLHVTRLSGVSIYNSTLLSLYIYKAKMGIENPLLSAVVRSFIYSFSQFDLFVEKRYAFEIGQWIYSRGTNYFVTNDKQTILNDLNTFENDSSLLNLIRFCKFEIDLADYLASFPELPLPSFPESDEKILEFLPQKSSDIGINYKVNYRSLPPNYSPPAPHPYEHSQALSLFKQFMKELKEIDEAARQYLLTDPETLTCSEMLLRAYKWGFSHQDSLTFTRIFAFIGLYPTGIQYSSEKFKEMLQNEFIQFSIPVHFFTNKQFLLINDYVFPWVTRLSRTLCLQSCEAHRYILQNAIKGWTFFSPFIIEISHKIPATYPKTSSDEINSILSSPLEGWTKYLSSLLIKFYCSLAIISNVLNPFDYSPIFLLLKSAYKTSSDSIKTNSIIITAHQMFESISKTSNKPSKGKKKNQLLRAPDLQKQATELAIQNGQPLDEALSYYYSAVAAYSRFAFSDFLEKYKSKNFVNLEAQYMRRIGPSMRIYGITSLNYQMYSAMLSAETGTLQEITKKYFQTAKDMVGKIANSSGKLPELMTLLKKIVVDLLGIKDWNESKHFEIIFDPYPSFAIK